MMENKMDFEQWLKNKKDIIDHWLKELLPGRKEFPEKIHEAMYYSIFAGGKRIRPILSILTAEILGYNDEIVKKPACALEMIHTYSLIHDDLPAMDDDDFRRGHPTNHKVYGEDIAILAGDALLTEAFYILSQLKSDKLPEILRIIALSSSSRGMVGGQAIDIIQTNNPTDINLLKKMHARKTGALLTAPIECAAVLCGEKNTDNFRELGDNIGMLFQITDDILDIRGNEAELGKPIGSDMSLGKSTFVSLLGIEKSEKEAEKYFKSAIKSLHRINVKNNEAVKRFEELIRFIHDRSH